MLKSKKAIEKIKRAWQGVPQNFNFYIWNSDKLPRDIPFDILNSDEFLKKYPELKDKIKISSDTITVLYTNNITARNNFVPLTAWILAHRMAHPLQARDKESPKFQELEKKLFKILNDIGTLVYNKPIKETTFLRDPKNFEPIVNAIMTMRSARKGKLANSLDITPELFAQYILVGKVKFNPLPDQIQGEDYSYSRPAPNPNIMLHADPAQQQIYDAKLQDFTIYLANTFYEVLESLKGKVVIF